MQQHENQLRSNRLLQENETSLTLQEDWNCIGLLALRSCRCPLIIVVLHVRGIHLWTWLRSIVRQCGNISTAPHSPAFGSYHTGEVDFPGWDDLAGHFQL